MKKTAYIKYKDNFVEVELIARCPGNSTYSPEYLVKLPDGNVTNWPESGMFFKLNSKGGEKKC